MNKLAIRQYKSHYGTRWSEFKHNRKNVNKILLLENKFVLANLLPGSVLAINCLGEVYKDIIDIDTSAKKQYYDNLLLINNIEFKYKTPAELVSTISGYSILAKRIIVNLNLAFVIYNKLCCTPESLLSQLEQLLAKSHLCVIKKFFTMKIKNHGFGNVFLVLEKSHA